MAQFKVKFDFTRSKFTLESNFFLFQTFSFKSHVPQEKNVVFLDWKLKGFDLTYLKQKKVFFRLLILDGTNHINKQQQH